MKKKRIPKELLNLMKRRENAAWKLMSLDAEVQEMLTNLGVSDTDEHIKYQNDYGCMLTTEPSDYYDEEIKIIEKFLNK